MTPGHRGGGAPAASATLDDDVVSCSVCGRTAQVAPVIAMLARALAEAGEPPVCGRCHDGLIVDGQPPDRP